MYRNEKAWSSSEFEEGSVYIMNNIEALKSNWQELERSYKAINRKKNTTQFQMKSLQGLQAKTEEIIRLTDPDIRKLSDYIRSSKADKKQKLFFEKLAVEFDSIVEHYKEVQKQLDVMLRSLPKQEDPVNRMKSVVLDDVDGLVVQIRQSMVYNNLCLQDLQFQKIQTEVSDLNTIMKDLNNIVEEQGETVGWYS